MAVFLPQAQIQAPRNAMLDLSPINEAIDSNRRNRMLQSQQELDRERMGMQREELGMRRDEHQMRQRQFDAQQQQQIRQRFGSLAQMVALEPDPAKRRQMWPQVLRLHPNARELDPSFLDPDQGPRLLMAEAGIVQDPLERQKAQAQLGLIGAQTESARAQTDIARQRLSGLQQGGLEPKDRAEMETKIRKEYAGLAKPYFEVRDAFSRVEQAASQPSAAGDLALIFNYMKMLDPGSVVREGEFATAQNAAGVPDRVRNLWNRLLSGERLNENQRGDFVGQARGLFSRQERQYQALQNQYRGIAERLGLDPRNTILDFTIPAASAPQIPAGAIQLLRSNPTPEIIQQFEQKYGVRADQYVQGQ